MTKIGIGSLFLAANLCLAATLVDPNTRFEDYVSAGELLTIKLTTSVPQVTVDLYQVGSNTSQDSRTLTPTADNSIKYALSSPLKPGRYMLHVESGQFKEFVPGELRVKAAAVRLESLHPTTAYRTAGGKGFDFSILGDNFSTDASQDRVIVDGQGNILKSYSNTKEQCKGIADADKLPCLWVENSQKMHVVGYQAEKYQGVLNLSVQVGDSVSEKQRLILARMSGAGVLIVAIVSFGLLCFFIYRLVARTLDPQTADGRPLPPWAAFLLDKQTDTYSLSKFQLFLFSAVFVFSYIYLFLCRWLVQWVFDLPDVPSEVSTMLGLSGGTTIAAVGATLSRGTKGSGRKGPSVADFVSTGGLVVAERFQFFVWTIVACAGFVALVLSQNPATVSGFPQFPQGLLYVMGVSSAGYLAGKLTRKPGPNIRNIAIDTGSDGLTSPPGAAQPAITIQGENFSNDADFFIDGHKLPLVTGDAATHKDLVTRTPQEGAPGYSSQLKIAIDDKAGVDLKADDHTFRILNPDGQFSDITFTPTPMIVSNVTDDVSANAGKSLTIRAGKDQITANVAGRYFKMGTTATWKAPGDNPKPAEVTYVDAANFRIRLVPGNAGTGTLLLVTPTGYTAMKEVTVEAAPNP